MPVLDPEHRHTNSTDQPEQSIGQINPHGILHPLYTCISLRMLLDVQIAKYAKQGDPEDEEDTVPCESERDPRHEGNHVEDGGDSREGAGNYCVDLDATNEKSLDCVGRRRATHPFPIAVLMLFVRPVDICAI
jgi:hypothetical protein